MSLYRRMCLILVACSLPTAVWIVLSAQPTGVSYSSAPQCTKARARMHRRTRTLAPTLLQFCVGSMTA